MTDLATSLASVLEAAVEERCVAIRAEAEKVIEAFRGMAQKIAAGEIIAPPPPSRIHYPAGLRHSLEGAQPETTAQPPVPDHPAPNEEMVPVKTARVRNL